MTRAVKNQDLSCLLASHIPYFYHVPPLLRNLRDFPCLQLSVQADIQFPWWPGLNLHPLLSLLPKVLVARISTEWCQNHPCECLLTGGQSDCLDTMAGRSLCYSKPCGIFKSSLIIRNFSPTRNENLPHHEFWPPAGHTGATAAPLHRPQCLKMAILTPLRNLQWKQP